MQNWAMKLRTPFGKIISLLAIVNLIGCTSLQTIDAPPDQLHQQIRHESVVKVGDKVRIVTKDQEEHQFVITALDENEIRGADVTIPIDSIATLETREFSTGKTVLLGVSITGTVLLIATLLLIAVAAPVAM